MELNPFYNIQRKTPKREDIDQKLLNSSIMPTEMINITNKPNNNITTTKKNIISKSSNINCENGENGNDNA